MISTVRQWVLSFPIPLRILFAAHPELLTPVLRIIHRVIARFLLKQAGVKRTAAEGAGAGLAYCIKLFVERNWRRVAIIHLQFHALANTIAAVAPGS